MPVRGGQRIKRPSPTTRKCCPTSKPAGSLAPTAQRRKVRLSRTASAHPNRAVGTSHSHDMWSSIGQRIAGRWILQFMLARPQQSDESHNISTGAHEQGMNRIGHSFDVELQTSPLNERSTTVFSKTLGMIVALATLAYAGFEFRKTSISGMVLADKQSAFVRFLVAFALGLFTGVYTLSH
jgi:hypothetical protein